MAVIRIKKIHRFSYYVRVEAASRLEAQIEAHGDSAPEQAVLREDLFYLNEYLGGSNA